MGLPDARNGAPPSGFGTGSLVGSLRPVNPATGGLVGGGPYTTLGGCNPSNVDANGFCRFDAKDWIDIQPENERFNILGRGTFAITPDMQLYGEASYFQFKTKTRNTPSQPRSTWPNVAGNGINDSTTIFLPVGHPDNPFSAQGNGGRLYYSTGNDIGGRNGDYESNMQRYLAGLKGTHFGWDWDTGLTYIKQDSSNTRTGFLNFPNFTQAINGQGGFGYYRIGQNASLNNPGIYGFISPPLTNDVTSETTQFDVKGSRDLMKLDGGQLALAVGYEFRREELDNPGYPGTFTGDIIGLGYSAASGSRNINAVYAELYAPVLKNLELTAALRFDDYSDAGNTTNPKFGVKWTVVPQLVARGTYTMGFRAPGPYESGNSAAAGFTSYRDPVRCPVTNSPADCGNGQVVSDHQRQSAGRARDVDQLDRRSYLGAGAAVQRVARLLEHRDQGPDRRVGSAIGHRQSGGFPELHARARHEQPARHREFGDGARGFGAVCQCRQHEDGRHRHHRALASAVEGVRAT